MGGIGWGFQGVERPVLWLTDESVVADVYNKLAGYMRVSAIHQRKNRARRYNSPQLMISEWHQPRAHLRRNRA